jgi:hypothetical protein
MTIAARTAHSPAGFLLILFFHALVLVGLLYRSPSGDTADKGRYSGLIFVTPAAPILPQPAPPTPRTVQRENAPRVTMPAAPDTSRIPDIPTPRETSSRLLPPISASADPRPSDSSVDPFHAPARVDVAGLIRQAGKADRDTRPVNETSHYAARPDSIEAVLSRGFAEARMAVPPKWFEAARVELFSAPNDPRKIYQVKTAFGTFCLFYPDKNASQSGAADLGQPRMAPCPKPFGK